MKDLRKVKNFLINPKRQLYYFFICFTPVVFALAIHTLLLVRTIKNAAPSSTGNLDFEVDIINSCLYSSLIAIFFAGIFSFILNIIITHQFFGAIYAIEKYLTDLMNNKERGKLVPRKYDETKNLVKIINDYIDFTQRKK